MRSTIRRRGRSPALPWGWILTGAALCAGLLAGLLLAGGPGGPTSVADASGSEVLVLVTGTGNERRPALPEEGRALLRTTALDGDTPVAIVLGIDGDGTTTKQPVDLTPRRGNSANGDVERTPKRRDAAADRNVAKVDAMVADTVATKSGHALLAGLQEAGRLPAKKILVVSSGIDTNDPFDLRKTGFDYPAGALIAYLTKKNALPKLADREVVLALSPPDGAQAALNEPSRRNLERLWTAVLKASGAQVRLVASRSSAESAGTVATPAVDVPAVPTPRPTSTPGSDELTFVMPAALLFEPNQAILLDAQEARVQLRTVVDHVTRTTTLTIRGHTAFVAGAPQDGVPLSRQRAQVIERLLRQLGVHPAAITKVDGVGHRDPLVQPSDDPRNRVVVVVLTTRRS
jgi:outer membrane protein OmpA-like peptidoglycan-associated protein